jgi:predicted acetylornithine/succinylornithine family transaminase
MESWISETRRWIMNTYPRLPVLLTRGEGCRVFDEKGKAYLDFVAGIAVNNLGHCHPDVVSAIREQAGRLIHASNLYHVDRQLDLARLLVERAFSGKVFFCNSGAEANEAAIKLARKFAKGRSGPGRFEIVTMLDSFHGRTLAALSATGQTKYQKGFEPLVPGFTHVPFDDLTGLEKAVTDRVAAVMIEPILGEGGVRIPKPGYLAAVRKICAERGALLILDEVQTGMGRTGRFFAHEWERVRPDILTLAKGLGGGFPIGAMLAADEVAEAFTPGSHASTFGGNPLACAAAIASVGILSRPETLDHCRKMGEYLIDRLSELAARRPVIREVRGKGLLVGAELAVEALPVVERALSEGLLLNRTGERVLRFVPPLIVTPAEIDEMLAILDRILPEGEHG